MILRFLHPSALMGVETWKSRCKLGDSSADFYNVFGFVGKNERMNSIS